MRRRLERSLLITALGIGLAGACLVAVARGATLDQGLAEGDAPTFFKVIGVWLQIGAAALVCHVVLALKRPGCDQVLLPTSVALTSVGMAIIFSLSPNQAEKQVIWLWVSLAVFLATVFVAPDFDRLRQYKYTFGLITALLLLLPMFLGHMVNGARLWIGVGGLTLQPGELAKVTLVLFLAGYLSEKGELLATERRRLGPFTLPDPQFLVPLVALWGLAILILVRLRDMGTALLFFGTSLTMVFYATEQAGFLVAGAVAFALGAAGAAKLFGHVRTRFQVWLDPWSHADAAGYQVLQGLFAIGAGGAGGVGLGLGAAASIPAATTDYPFAAICEELGLWGAAVVVALYLVWLYRALYLALAQPNRYRALLAAGLGCLMATQALVIMAGVTKLIPLTGITLPFVSYGGSSLVTNYLVLGLLLRASEVRR